MVVLARTNIEYNYYYYNTAHVCAVATPLVLVVTNVVTFCSRIDKHKHRWNVEPTLSTGEKVAPAAEKLECRTNISTGEKVAPAAEKPNTNIER